ncbi:hypothetical protein OKA04_16960 [Luteolibacter flavescens]|uniref:Uncharacterized protein n=1 Tax=Luteolibacter flavescens TaxID=1859460 RepID=A0ABT3FT61_9BACT|nr:hypothetical protein [Luteolibacter flavescens]MCW1886431.1 hypothetical protein [Luteolibacter flavescens]
MNAEPVLMERTAGLRAVPVQDLAFEVADQGDGFTVTISSARWTIEGCGRSSRDGEIVLHSICGAKNPQGGRMVIHESGARAGHRLLVQDSLGEQHLIP